MATEHGLLLRKYFFFLSIVVTVDVVGLAMWSFALAAVYCALLYAASSGCASGELSTSGSGCSI